MAESQKRMLLTVGVFLIILVVSIILYAPPLNLIPHWTLVPPLILALSGCWLMVLAGIRSSNPKKYEQSPFSTFAWGLLLVAVGGAWYASSLSWVYSLAIILLALAALAIAAALKK